MMVEENSAKGFDCFKAQLSEQDFQAFSTFIYREYGIKMPPAKRIMLQGRLLKRIRELKMNSYSQYRDFFFSKEGQKKELFNFLNVITTNKTDFFREPVHFDFLSEQVLPDFSTRGGMKQPFKVWSAGVSSGEEGYTIAIVLSEFKLRNPGFRFEILGTDISNKMLETAAKGVYKEAKIDMVPQALKKRYFLRSKNRLNPTVRVIPELQKDFKLKYLNLMDQSYDVVEKFDVIFCRNVLIYFDRNTQEKVINRLCRHLKSDGYFFIGHSESLSGMDVPLENVKPTIFKRK
ncbi:CheR family methyltransferase [Thermophagus xiamenensis]|uniref:protein-glutamate O-methyltransferase n=1 Tax=Thermophagus xiamenensis TaxID=385682 RepID=A0A1I1ZCH7_9BACT|nr:CheR family methyltransferase [Thermophagus xiamenensis]SFE29461.1 MCP methyltransferase, CheR-type [Thermophagus xiamenensis]